MKIQTKEDALLTCFDLWIDLAASGSKDKSSWVGWKRNGGDIDDCVDYCPCCEYSIIIVKVKGLIDSCKKHCPIKWSDGHCEDSEFGDWLHAETPEESSKCALKIATLALEALTDNKQ